MLIFTEARVLCIAAFNYVCFVKTAGIMAASHFCSFSASNRGYLWTAAFLELLLCIDQLAFVVSTSFTPCPFSYKRLLFEVSAFRMAEEQTERELCVSVFEQLFSSVLSPVFGPRISPVCVCIFLLIARTPCSSLGLMETVSYK